MKSQRSAVSHQRSVWLVILGVLGGVAVTPVGFSQTNQVPIGGSPTGGVSAVANRLPTPSDFQRLQYYYAAAPNSPVPGSERKVFTLRPDRRWSGDWRSKVVAKPTRAQLAAITPVQFEVFRRAAAYTNGAWRVSTPVTNFTLATLGSLDATTYHRLRLSVERAQLQRQLQQLDQKLQQLAPASVPVAGQ